MTRRWRFPVQGALLALLWLSALGVWAADRLVQGQVTRVTDGDSLWLAPAAPAAPVEVRLLGIDAPEICQPWGPEARQALQELVLNRSVNVRTVGRDSYGRTLGTVYLDTLNVNKALVQQGHAWSARYKYDRGPYVADERMARALSRGLNGEGGAVMPKDFRRSHGPCHSEDVADARAATAVPAVPATASVGYRCDGRTRCAQMRSCTEATFFLKNCAGVHMDGNHDGVPCEQQWCRP